MTTLPTALRHLMGQRIPQGSVPIGRGRLESSRPASAACSASKRMMDVVGACCGLVWLAPVLALVAILIRLDSKGPVLFRQARMGLRGRVFACLKFRTMVEDAECRLAALETQNESALGVLFKIKDDPRVTPLGRFLRRTSLDELPQLWNVLVGEMSLIGPRPLQLRDSEKLETLDSVGYKRRLAVLPGISGPWQVAGRSNLDGGQMLDLDLDYVENWSLSRDIDLLLKTLSVVFSGRGAS